MTELITIAVIAVALAMDAFAVSIVSGAAYRQLHVKHALRIALFFGAFQAVMPLIGSLAGLTLKGHIARYDHWVAAALLTAVGAKMIYEGLSEGIEEDIEALTHKMMLLLAIATSIDAMAAGFSLTLLEVNAWLACLIIGVTTFAFSWVGVLIGERSGTWLESKAEIFGGVVLILIGVKMLVM